MENFRYDEEPLKIELTSCALDRIFVYIFSTIFSNFHEKKILRFFVTPQYIYIRCTTFLPPFFTEFKVLFLKSDYLFMIQSIVRI